MSQDIALYRNAANCQNYSGNYNKKRQMFKVQMSSLNVIKKLTISVSFSN